MKKFLLFRKMKVCEINKEHESKGRVRMFIVFSVIILGSFLLLGRAGAVCPVCTVAVGVGVGLCRWLKIDDLISGIWLGGLIVSLILWTLLWLEKKQISFRLDKIIIPLFFYLVVILPLYWLGIMGHPQNRFWKMDKLLLGMIFGSISFSVGSFLHNFLKAKNGGKSFFPFQKVILPLIFLVVTTLFFYQIIKC